MTSSEKILAGIAEESKAQADKINSDAEKQAADMGVTTEIRKLPMTFSGRFMAENEGETGLCKLILDAEKQTVLGVHCIGNPCSEFIAAASCAVSKGYTVAEMQQVVFPHPTVSEILHEVLH